MCPVTNLPVLVVFGRFLEFFFSIWNTVLLAKDYIFFLISILLIHLFSLVTLARISTTMFTSRGEGTFLPFYQSW